MNADETTDDENNADSDPEQEDMFSGTSERPKNSNAASENNRKNPTEQQHPSGPSPLTTRFLKDIELSDWITAIATVAIAIMTAFYVFYSRGQLAAMNRQLDEMKKATVASQSAAYAACVSAQISRGALIEVQRNEADSHEATVAAVYQAIAATNSEIAVITMLKTSVPEFGNGIRVPIDFKNTGKTQAKNVRIKIEAVFLERHADPDFSFKPHHFSRFWANVLDSGATLSSKETSFFVTVRSGDGSDYLVTEANMAALRQGEKDILVYGRIDYADIFGVPHWATFCEANQIVEFGTRTSTAHPKCVSYNKTDNNGAIGKDSSNLPQPGRIPEIACTPPSDDPPRQP